jgi:hypothetical protein
MSEQIEAGEGWRLIDKEKCIPEEGDEVWCSCTDKWMPIFKGDYFCDGDTYRRRIPAKPEPYGVVFYEWRVIDGKAVIRIDMERAEFNAMQARQLADWLNRYADWREAQESK